jgi:PAS domain S-box-containing protein
MVDTTQIDAFFGVSPNPVWLVGISGDCIYGNPALERLTGLDSGQINRADWRSFLVEEDRPGATVSWQRSLATGTPYQARVRMRRIDGVVTTVELNAFVHKAGDRTEAWLFAGLPIRDFAPEQPPFEVQLRAMLNLIPAYTWYAVPSGGLTFVNARFADYLGLPQDHPLRLGLHTGTERDSHVPLLHPDDREETRRVGSTCLSGGCAGEVSFRVRSAEGSYRWFLSRAEPLRSSDGTLLFWIGINLDIEERRQADFYLTEGQRLAHAGSWAFNSSGFDYWSSELFKIHGLDDGGKAPSVEEYLGLVHPEDRAFVAQELQELFANHSGFDFTKRIVRPDGKVRHVRWVAVPASHETRSERFVGTGIDVTEQVQLTEEIKRRETYFAQAQRLSHTGSFGWKPRDGEIVWSDQTYCIFEYDPGKTPTLDMVLERVHPEDSALAHQVIERASKTGTEFEHELRLLMPTAAIKHIHVRAHSQHDGFGNTEIIGAVTDITERKTAEEKVREQEAELRQVLDFTPQLIAVFGPKHERLYINRIALDYLGIGLEEWLRRLGLAEVHPDDQEKLQVHIDSSFSNGSAFELELRVLSSDGSYRWLLARYNPVRDDNGRIKSWYVACTDIEDRKRAEERLRQENLALREEIDQASMFEEIVGSSPALQTVLSSISKVAPSNSTVLITGETGTGKELFARSIHRRSNRSAGPFISVNCAAIPRDLIPSELFGHEKGAFTGAMQKRLGRFELADGGTIFLDEVGELSPDTQAAILRVLQEREFERVGAGQSIPVDVRVIAATNRDLKEAVANRTFRQDLFYRLNVFPITVPPLRDRKDDILMLVEYFVQRYATKAGKNIRSIDKKTLDVLQSYDWPGNIRELQNVIERSVILSFGNVFSIDELWLSNETSRPHSAVETAGTSREVSEPPTEREIIEQALAETRGRVSGPSGAAARLGIPPSTLATRIKALKINKDRFKFLRLTDSWPPSQDS